MPSEYFPCKRMVSFVGKSLCFVHHMLIKFYKLVQHRIAEGPPWLKHMWSLVTWYPMKSSGGGVVQFPYFFPCFSFLILPFMKQMKHDVPACCWSLLTKLVAKVYPMNSINKLMFFFFFFFFSYDANISRLFFIATSLIRFLFFLFFFLVIRLLFLLKLEPYYSVTWNFCGLAIFCVFQELIFAIRTDWFLLLGIIFCDFREYPVPIQHW